MKVFTNPDLSEETWPKRLVDDPGLYWANVDYTKAESDLAHISAVAALEAANPQVFVDEAEAGVRLAEAEEKTAQTAIDLCTVRAKSAGTIERVTIGPGTTLGIGTREPALWLIPAGKRIVRAEVEPDFAHRVGPEIEGKQVTVFDNTNTQLTYTGTVLHVGKTFLPKRSAGESILTNETRVLEAVIEIADAEPGWPPSASAVAASGVGSAVLDGLLVRRVPDNHLRSQQFISARVPHPLACQRRAMDALYAFMRRLPTTSRTNR